MDLAYLGLGLVFLIGIIRMFPNVFRPHCPICSAALESIDLETIGGWQSWFLVWHKFICPDCWYRWRRIEIARRPKGTEA